MKKGLFSVLFINLFLAASLFAQVDVPVPEGEVQVIDDFENGNYWIWAGSDWDRYGGHKSSMGCNLSKQHRTEGKYSMELLLEPVKPGASANWFYDGSQDLSGGKYVVADFYNPGPITYVTCIVFQATDKWEWLQSEMFNIPPGQHTVVFDVEKLNEHFNDVRRITISSFFFQECKEDSSLFVDNIRLIK